MKMSMTQAKQRLAILWFVGAGLVFFLVLIQTNLGKYGDKTSEVWSWLMPTIMPNLSLIIGVFVIDALGRGLKIGRINAFLFKLTFGLSCAYLIAVLIVFLLQPWSSRPPLEHLQQANAWLGVFQGLVAAGMGAFFSTASNAGGGSPGGETPAGAEPRQVGGGV